MRSETSGALFAAAAFGIWGITPLYYDLLRSVPAPETVAHRVIWCHLLLGCFYFVRRGDWQALWSGGPRRLLWLALSGFLIVGNWLVFILAVLLNRVQEVSLGYYLSPLVSVLMGTLLLRERMSRLQWFGIVPAALGTLVFSWAKGGVSLIALGLAGSFAVYGLIRKRVAAPAIPGLWFETGLVLPVALVALGFWSARGDSSFVHAGWGLSLLLMCAGPVTAAPLVLFAAAARRTSLSTLGIMQYISPTILFLISVLVFREGLGVERLFGFALIWLGLGLYTLDLWIRAGRARRAGGRARA